MPRQLAITLWTVFLTLTVGHGQTKKGIIEYERDTLTQEDKNYFHSIYKYYNQSTHKAPFFFDSTWIKQARKSRYYYIDSTGKKNYMNSYFMSIQFHKQMIFDAPSGVTFYVVVDSKGRKKISHSSSGMGGGYAEEFYDVKDYYFRIRTTYRASSKTVHFFKDTTDVTPKIGNQGYVFIDNPLDSAGLWVFGENIHALNVQFIQQIFSGYFRTRYGNEKLYMYQVKYFNRQLKKDDTTYVAVKKSQLQSIELNKEYLILYQNYNSPLEFPSNSKTSNRYVVLDSAMHIGSNQITRIFSETYSNFMRGYVTKRSIVNNIKSSIRRLRVNRAGFSLSFANDPLLYKLNKDFIKKAIQANRKKVEIE
ncbi:MAG TPA: hypothetical protein VI731_00570 [Bacteroidia bacterium]|nr:hypothetical protein [Bacteroidia bacterium]